MGSHEIHADLILPPYHHTPFATVPELARLNSVAFMAPSKTFNMPSLAASHTLIFNEKLLQQFVICLEAGEIDAGHVFAFDSVAAAYNNGEEWLDYRALEMSHDEQIRFFADEAGLVLNDGASFGKEGMGFMRLNVATPRSVLEKAMS